MSETETVWYGPHACEVCGAEIVKAAIEDGGAMFDVPERLKRIYHRGSESGDVDVCYPMTWPPHVHKTERGPSA